METAVLSEIIKTLTHRGIEPQVCFWRTTAGTEVDIVVADGTKPVPIEVKLSATPRPGMATAVKTFQNDFGDKAMAGYVGHPGDLRIPLVPNVTALPFFRL
jgi:predicted AAA+ superfamily ATPase